MSINSHKNQKEFGKATKIVFWVEDYSYLNDIFLYFNKYTYDVKIACIGSADELLKIDDLNEYIISVNNSQNENKKLLSLKHDEGDIQKWSIDSIKSQSIMLCEVDNEIKRNKCDLAKFFQKDLSITLILTTYEHILWEHIRSYIGLYFEEGITIVDETFKIYKNVSEMAIFEITTNNIQQMIVEANSLLK